MENIFDILQFDEYREDNRRWFASLLMGHNSVFVNCHGGVIILGVKEARDGTWRTTGLKDASKLRKDFFDTINNRKKVRINLVTDDGVEGLDGNKDRQYRLKK